MFIKLEEFFTENSTGEALCDFEGISAGRMRGCTFGDCQGSDVGGQNGHGWGMDYGESHGSSKGMSDTCF